jgi:hypothetical protein
LLSYWVSDRAGVDSAADLASPAEKSTGIAASVDVPSSDEDEIHDHDEQLGTWIMDLFGVKKADKNQDVQRARTFLLDCHDGDAEQATKSVLDTILDTRRLEQFIEHGITDHSLAPRTGANYATTVARLTDKLATRQPEQKTQLLAAGKRARDYAKALNVCLGGVGRQPDPAR